MRHNAKNQECLFDAISDLEDLATPPEMKKHIDGVADSAKQDTHSRNSFQMNVQEGNTGARQWPFSLSDYGQAIIIELIKDNESLCERLPADIPKLFAMIAELSEYS